MRRIYSHIIYICLVAILFAGCRVDYPEKDFWGKVGYDNIDSRVPILVAIDNLQGTLGNDVKDGNVLSEEWANADFYVYAFYTSTNVKGAPVDVNYSERMDSRDDEKVYCLIDDTDNDNIGHGKKARLNRDLTSFLQWKDGDAVYFNSTYPEYCYKFFAYYLDDAANMNEAPVRGGNSVAYEISIDGTQNLMCGYTTLCPYGGNTGCLDVYPIFKMERQLALVKFNPDEQVENIIVTAPYRGRVVVAADDEAKIGAQFDDSEIKDYSSEEIGMTFLLPEADSYELQILTKEGDAPICRNFGVDGGFMAGHEYTVSIKVIDSENIELDVK